MFSTIFFWVLSNILKRQITNQISAYIDSTIDREFDLRRQYKPLIEYNEKAQETIDKKQDMSQKRSKVGYQTISTMVAIKALVLST